MYLDDFALAVDEALAPLLALAGRASTHASQHVSASQLQALFALDNRGQLNLSGLAEELDVLPSSATRLCDRLVAADLITRTAGSQDRREVFLDLTPTGRQTLEQIRAWRISSLKDALGQLTDRDRLDLLAGLGALAAALRLDPVEDNAAALG